MEAPCKPPTTIQWSFTEAPSNRSLQSPMAGIPKLFSLEYPLIRLFIFAYPILSYPPPPTIRLCKEDFINNIKGLAETSETITELDILDSVKDKKNSAMNCDEDEDDEDGNDYDAEISKTSHDQMLKSFETIRSGLQFEENTPKGVFGAFQRCETHYEGKHFFKQKNSDKINRLYQ
ncbi:hypothetical protein AVEN_28959-1 [Araneus ventricosus]|uniref:Uncharacterized protein n=1 Tax=Araneus ventricosus TaxID=182803 RepID=A0A4Y2AKZ6_ARAVE|nr:hypothetical protein AVEN_28959-1 [Araneus ventricosus]